MVWSRFQRLAYVCRYGHQSLIDLLGRRPTALELGLFEHALEEIIIQQNSSTLSGISTDE